MSCGNIEALQPGEYIVQKIIDVKWVRSSPENRKKPLYRVRWAEYGPSQDSWEPITSFNGASKKFIRKFDCHFKEMRKELKQRDETGLGTSTEINILSKEIDEIAGKRYERNDVNQIQNIWYRVKWKNVTHAENTWEKEEDLIHAKDKVNLYLHKRRIRKRNISSDNDSHVKDSERRIEHRNFWSSTEKEQVLPNSSDLYSNVKHRRIKSQEQMNKRSESERVGTAIRDEKPYFGELFENLPKYDSAAVIKELVKQAETTFELTEEEFTVAAITGDYPKVFGSLRHFKIPDVDFVKLFLETSRKGFRDVAMLLATKVPDLSVEDDYGYNALTMAAHQSDALFAHQLLVMGAALHQQTSQGHTAKSVALQFKDENFLRFLKNYDSGNLPF